MKSWLTTTAVLSCMLAVSGAALGVAAMGADDGIAREGAGERRERLNTTELKPFSADLWASLQGWSGTPLSAELTEGKVVVVVTWASWAKASHDALRLAQQMEEKYGKDGVIVVGVHHDKGFEGAAKVAADRGVTFLYAHDADGTFRKSLEVDQDPDFYVIDRAGNVRFADILTSAVEPAVRKAVGETAEQAAAIPSDLAAQAAANAAKGRMTKPVADDHKPGQILNVHFTVPEPSEYAAASWPEVNPDPGAGNHQGSALPAAYGAETWLTDKPNMTGRVVVLDFWATWCGPCKRAMPGLDALQKSNMKDLVIIGMSGMPAGNSKEDPAGVKQYLRGHKSAYYHANDLKKTIASAIQVNGIPHVVVMSTDGVIRWQGNPLDPTFRKAVEAVISADPGVKARRAAEAAFLKARG